MDRNKGASILDRLSNYTVIDLETTGLDPKYDEIIELGALKIRAGKIVETYQQLVKPESPIDVFISELTGITNDMVENAPNIREVINEYTKFIGDDIIVGHNVNFDINFIYDKLLAISSKELKNNYIDTMRLARKILRELEHHRLKDLVKYYSISIDGSHRSIADCKATVEIYNRL